MVYCDVILVKIQLDLTFDQDRIVEVYKLVHRLKTKQEAIQEMIEHFEVEIKPKNVNGKEYFK